MPTTMTPSTRRLLIVIACTTAAMLTLLWWYRLSATPLSQDEVEHYLAEIEAQPKIPGGDHDLAALRAFLQSDDGKPFYTVNLYTYYDVASYPPGSPHAGSGRDAFDRFSDIMIPLLASHASHPIFGSDWIDPSETRWDRIVIVRYRSRRDLASIFASPRFAEGAVHKWAALQDNERMLVQGLHLPELYLLGLLALGGAGMGALVLAQRGRERQAVEKTPRA